jgi:hypothetical protein
MKGDGWWNSGLARVKSECRTFSPRTAARRKWQVRESWKTQGREKLCFFKKNEVKSLGICS